MSDDTEIERLQARLIAAGWKLAVYRPENDPRFWNMTEAEIRRGTRWYICPTQFYGTFEAKLRDTELEALRDIELASPSTGDRITLECGCILEKIEQPPNLIDGQWFRLISGCGMTDNLIYGTHEVGSGGIWLVNEETLWHARVHPSKDH